MPDIFQEVEEDVRRERYQALWKKHGVSIIAIAVVFVLGVGGYQAWLAYDQNRREDASNRFAAAQALTGADNAARAEEAFRALAQDAPAGYATLAKFHLASTLLAQGKRDEAIAQLRELAATDDVGLSGVARIRLAWLLADTSPRADVEAIIAPLNGPDNPWRFAAGELAAYLDLKAGARDKAETAYAGIAQDPGASDGLRRRAAAISDYLKANTQPGGTPSPASPQETTQE